MSLTIRLICDGEEPIEFDLDDPQVEQMDRAIASGEFRDREHFILGAIQFGLGLIND